MKNTAKSLAIKQDLFFQTSLCLDLSFVAGLVLPILLIFVVQFTGYSEIVEELAKALVISLLILRIPGFKTRIFAGMTFGFLFGLSENFLYLNQILQMGDLSIFWHRFLWTVPMHIVTVGIMVLAGTFGNKWLVLGWMGAVILHILFNLAVLSLAVNCPLWGCQILAAESYVYSMM